MQSCLLIDDRRVSRDLASERSKSEGKRLCFQGRWLTFSASYVIQQLRLVDLLSRFSLLFLLIPSHLHRLLPHSPALSLSLSLSLSSPETLFLTPLSVTE